MKKSIVLGILAAIGVATIVVGVVLTQSGKAPTNEPDQQARSNSDSTVPTTDRPDDRAGSANETAGEAGSVVIVYTDNGFEKDSYTVKKGQTVIVRNQSSAPLEFSSDDHPAHTDNSELNLRAVASGGEATLAPTRTGTWGIHDHRKADHTTELIVVE